MFTPVQITILIIFTEFFIYTFLSKCLDTIKHCSTSKAYRKGLEKGIITPNKEEKKDENN